MNLSTFTKTGVDVLLTFLFFFSFPCALFYRSSVIALPIIALLVLLSRETLQKIQALLRTGQVWRSLAWPLVFALYAYIWTRIQQEFEDSLVRSSLIYFGFLAGSLLLYCHLSRRHGPIGVLKIFFYSFLLQSVIQILSFVWEPFLKLSRIISPIVEGNSEILYGYITWRGFALSGVKFFGLSVVYSFVLVYYVYFQRKKLDWKKLAFLLVFVVGGFFSARSFFLGILAAFGVLFFSSGGIKNFFKIIFAVVIVILAFPLVAPVEVEEKFREQLYPWLFEMYYSYQSTGKAEARSLNVLVKGHYFVLSFKQIFLGDGIYEIADGLPYKDTDAGYWRLLLFGGIPYLLMRLFFLLRLLRPIYLLRLTQARPLFFILLVMVLLFQVKGDVLGGLTMMSVCFFFFSMIAHELNLSWQPGARLGERGWLMPKLLPRHPGRSLIHENSLKPLKKPF